MHGASAVGGLLLPGALFAVCSVWLVWVLPAAHRPIGAAAAVILAVAWLGARRMIDRRGAAPLDEIGFWYLGILAVYCLLPLASGLVLGLQYTPFNDLRLYELQPSAAEVARIGWLYALYLGTFVGVYLLFRPRDATVAALGVRPLSRSAMVVAGSSWLVIEATLVWLRLQFDASAATYMEQYQVMQSLPLLARQLFKLLFGMRFVLLLVLLLWLLSHVRLGAWLAFLWLGGQVWLTVAEGGSRTELMVSGAAVLILFHRVVRPLSVRAAFVAGASAVVLFLALGLVRDVQNLGDEAAFLGVRTNEFESIFANAIDVQDRKARGELRDVRGLVAFSDLAAVVPSQLAPFQKDDVADWYVRTFYPDTKERGGGYAFGAVTQAVAGWGWLEVVLRASIVAAACAMLHRYYRRRADQAWAIILNTWAIVWVYESFRASTFYMLHIFLQQFVVTFAFIEIGRRVLAGVASRRPAASGPPAETPAWSGSR